MAEETAKILIRKGKIASAAFVSGVCRTSSPCAVTEEIFNSAVNPTIPIHDGDLIDWCRWLIAGGQTPEEFFQTVKKYDNATTCGLVWTANFVAYRCRTCGISPCMSLCSECFQMGDHEGHDFNMFRSQAGGACDCGDKGVMKESGFCQRHGTHNASNRQEAPRDLLCVAEVLMPRLFLRLVQHLRVNYESDRLYLAPHMADSFLTLLQTHSEMGAAMRGVMTKALLDHESYFKLAIRDLSVQPNPLPRLRGDVSQRRAGGHRRLRPVHPGRTREAPFRQPGPAARAPPQATLAPPQSAQVLRHHVMSCCPSEKLV